MTKYVEIEGSNRTYWFKTKEEAQNQVNKWSTEEMAELSKCDGKHSNLNDLFECESCKVLFNKPEKELV